MELLNGNCCWLLTSGLLLSYVSCCVTANYVSNAEILCYSCKSDVDSSCISEPSTVDMCSTTHGKGCATRISIDGVVERGCSDMGLTPQGCQVSSIFGTECVCHLPRCNRGIPAYNSEISTKHRSQTVQCYNCTSRDDSGCGYDVTSDHVQIASCPAQDGCYFMKQLDDNGIMNYDRLCFANGGPAIYYPSGCYTVFNEKLGTSYEVCVCYADKCNKSSLTSLGSASKKEEISAEDNSSNINQISCWVFVVIFVLNLVDAT